VFVGIDVVDLRDPRAAGKAGDERFVARVLSTQEAAWVRAAAAEGGRTTPAAADLRLWCLWAAKEAAFKTASRMLGGPPPFHHAAFRVELPAARAEPASTAAAAGEEASPGAPRTHTAGADAAAEAHRSPLLWPGGRSLVTHGGLTMAVAFDVSPERVVALAWTAAGGAHAPGGSPPDPPPDLHWGVEAAALPGDGDRAAFEAFTAAHFDAAERPAVHSPASAAVRLAARRGVSRALGMDEREVRFPAAEGHRSGRTPPVVAVAGHERPDLCVSLSHHGRWVAWALVGCEPDGGADPGGPARLRKAGS